MLIRCYFLQAEDGIRDAQESRGLGDVYKRQLGHILDPNGDSALLSLPSHTHPEEFPHSQDKVVACLLYTSDAADDLPCVDLGGRRILQKKQPTYESTRHNTHSCRTCTPSL